MSHTNPALPDAAPLADLAGAKMEPDRRPAPLTLLTPLVRYLARAFAREVLLAPSPVAEFTA